MSDEAPRKHEDKGVDAPFLSLSTQVEPPKTFEIDGVQYELRGIVHLTPDEEADVTASFTRFQQQANRLERAGNDREAKTIAAHLRDRRLKLIGKVTSVPQDVIESLPFPAQIQLFNAVAEEFSGLDDGES